MGAGISDRPEPVGLSMQIRFLLVTGPNTEPAIVEFGPGLNVIHGGSNTGKSYILRLIDYMLGASSLSDLRPPGIRARIAMTIRNLPRMPAREQLPPH